MNFARVLEQVADHLSSRGHRFAVVGALALHAYGITRATADLDLVVEQQAQPDLLSFLDRLGYEQLHVSASFSNHVHRLGSLGRLDFIYVDEATATRLFAEAREVALFPGLRVRVPKPEHLAAMKVLAMKNDPSRSLKELADIQLLMDVPEIDLQFVRAQFKRHGLEARFDELAEARDQQRR